MNAPRRIQLRRTRGFRLQEVSKALNGLSCVKIDRSTPWGNPFIVGKGCSRFGAVNNFAAMVTGLRTTYFGEECLERQRAWARYAREHLHELRGKNLACWCREGEPCHADILLKIANR